MRLNGPSQKRDRLNDVTWQLLCIFLEFTAQSPHFALENGDWRVSLKSTMPSHWRSLTESAHGRS
jgi:hypothetical protein